MKFLRKIWVRILLSLFMGGMVAETVHIKFGDIPQQTSTTIVWIGAGIAFGLLSLIVWIEKYRYYYFSNNNEEENILDDSE